MVLERSSQISTIGLLGQHLNLDLRCVPLFVQPHPTKSSTFDGNFDGNYMAGTRLHEPFQSLTDQLDPTHSHHLINGLRRSLFVEVGHCDHIVTADRADSLRTPGCPAPFA